MRRLLSALPFAAVLFLMFASVFAARIIHAASGDAPYYVNTSPEPDGAVHTIRVFGSITSVVIIDGKNHSHKKKIGRGSWSYDTASTRLRLSETLPFEENIIHIEGTGTVPERFCLHDFDGAQDTLLVLLKNRAAIAGYEYRYDEQTRTITFRDDIRPERDGNFHIAYQTAGGAMRGFGNWSRKDGDRLAELQSQWLARTQHLPPVVMKDRSGVSKRRLQKETGFSVLLPQGSATFLAETMEGTERRCSVLRYYDDAGLSVECQAVPFEESEAVLDEETIVAGTCAVRKRRIIGSETDGRGEMQSVALSLYTWEQGGTCYQLSAAAGKEADAEALLQRIAQKH